METIYQPYFVSPSGLPRRSLGEGGRGRRGRSRPPRNLPTSSYHSPAWPGILSVIPATCRAVALAKAEGRNPESFPFERLQPLALSLELSLFNHSTIYYVIIVMNDLNAPNALNDLNESNQRN